MSAPTQIITCIAASLAALSLACGSGDLDSASTPTPSSPAKPAAAAPQATPAPEKVDESGLIVRDLKLDAGAFGGSIEAVLFNSLETVCHAAITLEVLRQDGTALVSFGIQGVNLDPGMEATHSGKYVGKGATDTKVVYTTCEGRHLTSE